MPTSPADARLEQVHLLLTGVTAGYGGAPVIQAIDLAVAREEVVTIVGPNGAGKSTLLKCVLGVLRPMEGEIVLAGRRIDGERTDRIARAGVGYVPQTRAVFETLTVRETLEMGGYSLHRREILGRVAEIFDLYPQLGTMSKRYGGHLSGGERKMLAMGRVLMTRPSLLVLDEPTAGLSPQLSHELLHTHVARLAKTGIAILLVEQHAREALAISDWAYLLVSGQVHIEESAKDLLARPDIGEIFLGRAADGTSAADELDAPPPDATASPA